ncbi:hypothetical protein DQW77_04580 [Roseovarius sp. TE539]|nr:hypothetical protein DQW77_04580 [Roseovarius sp. TE539]
MRISAATFPAMSKAISFVLCTLSGSAWAEQVVVIGEIHDNPHHHEEQARIVADLDPEALVFEMLTPAQAARVTPRLMEDEDDLAALLNWEDTGWPDFSMYFPIFAAAPDALVYGAGVPRDVARAAMKNGVAAAFGGDAARYGLDRPLADDDQRQREKMQMTAHCDALPEAMLPGMVAAQRLRDAELARAVMLAMTATGGPVTVITGNGHARRDQGIPVYLDRVAPELELRVIGQTENGSALEGRFDEVRSAPAVDRPDPCAAFR